METYIWLIDSLGDFLSNISKRSEWESSFEIVRSFCLDFEFQFRLSKVRYNMLYLMENYKKILGFFYKNRILTQKKDVIKLNSISGLLFKWTINEEELQNKRRPLAFMVYIILRYFMAYDQPITYSQIKERTGFSTTRIYSILSILRSIGVIVVHDKKKPENTKSHGRASICYTMDRQVADYCVDFDYYYSLLTQRRKRVERLLSRIPSDTLRERVSERLKEHSWRNIRTTSGGDIPEIRNLERSINVDKQVLVKIFTFYQRIKRLNIGGGRGVLIHHIEPKSKEVYKSSRMAQSEYVNWVLANIDKEYGEESEESEISEVLWSSDEEDSE